MLTPILLALRQLPDPAFYGPVLKAVALAALAFAGLALGAGWMVQHWLVGGWFGGLAAALAGVLVLVTALWLFLPVALALTGLFLEPVAAAVERRFYPTLPPARGASGWAQAAFGVKLGLWILLLNLVALPLLLLAPPLGAALFFLAGTVAFGHGTFEAVAQRRMSVADARRLRWRRELPVLALGALLAAAASVPVLGLLVPTLGTAAMVHLLHRHNGGAPQPTEFRG